MTVTLVARTAKFRSLREEPHAVMYLPLTHGGFPDRLYLVSRTTTPAAAAIGGLQAIVRELGPRVPPEAGTSMNVRCQQCRCHPFAAESSRSWRSDVGVWQSHG